MAEFLRANYSWTLGYTRVNYEYARCALALGRPRDAIYPLQAALRGGLEGPQLYVTQTELHELLGQALVDAGMPDSARPHYQYVTRMWSGADREFTARHRRAVDSVAGPRIARPRDLEIVSCPRRGRPRRSSHPPP